MPMVSMACWLTARVSYRVALRRDCLSELIGRSIGTPFIEIRAEMLMPFFDMEFIGLIAAAEIDLFIGHKMYVDWMRLFQPPVYATPWQAYPGHVPCPLPMPPGLDYQWTREDRVPPGTRRLARRVLRRCVRPLAFPGWLLRRDIVLAAAILTLLGLRNYGYLLEAAERFFKVIALCEQSSAFRSGTPADRRVMLGSRPLGVARP
jgi:hypothetical protein